MTRNHIQEDAKPMTSTRRLALLTPFLLLSALAFAAPETFTIDKAHSSVNFSVKHMMVSNVTGRFTDITGTVVYDEQDPTKSSVNATVKTASINTDNNSRDNDLRGPDFFDTAKYPEATFKSKKVEKRGDQWWLIGTLTIKDVSKDVEMPFEITRGKTQFGIRIGATAAIKINRQDYHLTYNKVMDTGGVMVSNEVKIEFNLEAGLAK